jgi:hypothetical protein
VSISELLLWFLIRRSEASFGDAISNKIYKFDIFCKHENRKMGESRNARHRITKDELQQHFNMTVYSVQAKKSDRIRSLNTATILMYQIICFFS